MHSPPQLSVFLPGLPSHTPNMTSRRPLFLPDPSAEPEPRVPTPPAPSIPVRSRRLVFDCVELHRPAAVRDYFETRQLIEEDVAERVRDSEAAYAYIRDQTLDLQATGPVERKERIAREHTKLRKKLAAIQVYRGEMMKLLREETVEMIGPELCKYGYPYLIRGADIRSVHFYIVVLA